MPRCHIYFNRGTRFRMCLNFVHFINLAYITISVPFQISFIDEMEVTLALEIISMTIQAFVIFVKFRTPIVKNG